MYDDKGIVNTDQDQVSSAGDNPATSRAYSMATFPPDGGLTSQPPLNNVDINQNDQILPLKIPAPTQKDTSSVITSEDSTLQDIKRTALQNLLPIVGKLDQPPEERFQTLLMIIQASDNRQLINEAYDTAAKIQDDGERAKALLAIINEINYFTQQPLQATQN